MAVDLNQEPNAEEKLDDLVTELFDAGLSFDEIISAFELKLMALREESPDE